jgi:hypothetical protein
MDIGNEHQQNISDMMSDFLNSRQIMASDKKVKLSAIEGGKDDVEKILVQKLKAKIIDADEINELINKLKIRRGHMLLISSIKTK